MAKTVLRTARLRADEFAEVDRIARERSITWNRAIRLLIRSHPDTSLDPNLLLDHHAKHR